MAFILYHCGNHEIALSCFVLQSAETGGYIGLIIAGNPNESGRAFSYDYGSIYQPEEILNLNEFPELAEMPFFAIDYAGFNQELIPKLHPIKDKELFNFLLAECKISGCHRNYSENKLLNLPLLWHYTPPNFKGEWKIPIWSLAVNKNTCWIGNRDGLIVQFNHQGDIINQYQLPQLIQCFLVDQKRIYAICNDGQIYEFKEHNFHPVYHLRPNTYYSDLNIFNVTFANQKFLIIDTYGNLKLIDSQLKEIIWENHDQLWRSWFLFYQDSRIYVGHSKGINCYEITRGRLLWKQPLNSPVLWGDLLNNDLIVGTSNGEIYQINKQGDWQNKGTKIKLLCTCKSASYSGLIIKNKNLIITSDCEGYIYGFNFEGSLIWQYQIETGAILDLKSWQNLLFSITTEGTIFTNNIQEIIL